jgi:hypothetical protein
MSERQGVRWRRGCGCLVVALVLLPVVLWLVALHSSNRQIDRLMGDLKRRGEPMTLAELAPKVPEGEENAATLYELASHVLVLSPTLGATVDAPSNQWSATDWKLARTFVAANGQYFRLLDHAAHLQYSAFPIDWNAGAALTAAHTAQLRGVTRHLLVRAEVAAAERDTDDALRWGVTAMRVARAPEREPALVGVLIAAVVRDMGAREMARLLDRGLPSSQACRTLYRELDDPGWNQAWVRGIKGARTTLASTAQQGLDQYVTSLGYSREALRWRAITTVGRPLVRRQTADNITYWTQEAELLSLPWPQAKPRQDALAKQIASRPPYMSLVRELGYSGSDRLIRLRDQATANLELVRVALALKAYRAEHATYPDTLAALADWRLPLDPFSMKPFLYRRQGKGFTIWSVGPDMVDNQATAYDSQRFKPDTPGYDFVLKCAQ